MSFIFYLQNVDTENLFQDRKVKGKIEALILKGLVVAIYTSFNNQKFYVLPTHWICVFYKYLRINSGHFHIQY